MNEVKIFENSEFGAIRTVTVNDEPMFCLADVCKALEITHVTDVKKRLKKMGSVLPRSLTALEEHKERLLSMRVIFTRQFFRVEKRAQKNLLIG